MNALVVTLYFKLSYISVLSVVNGYTDYKKYVRLSVNSYIALKFDGSIKRKNDFTEETRIDKGYFAPIIAKPVNNYFLKGMQEVLFASREDVRYQEV